ncbi:AAA family ATPase [Streptomyces kebangsaanensis]|uniref:AAA family ATPase n=1 Tax=Streptomyces kebangsaanensis TaxID=864058 RepID=UPI00093D651A|nr:AAA family ATPase [Streptomyces kebangsaanensis]
MITRIEIDGYKSFDDFALDLLPLTVLVGANASGESNLLEAVDLLGQLIREPAGQTLVDHARRGGPKELFWRGPDGAPAGTMRIAAHVLVHGEHGYGGELCRMPVEDGLDEWFRRDSMVVGDQRLGAKRRWTVGRADPDTGGNCRRVTPEVATEATAVRHAWLPTRRRPPRGRMASVGGATRRNSRASALSCGARFVAVCQLDGAPERGRHGLPRSWSSLRP